jgi:hypothetical protein
MKMLNKPDKYYVTNGPIKILVLALDPIDAVCQAISYLGFSNAEDFEQTMYNICEDDSFIVHPRGFRNYETCDIDGFEIYLDDAVDSFDEACRRFDPFCENKTHWASDQFYEDLGYEE